MFNWLLPAQIGSLRIYSEVILVISFDFNAIKVAVVSIRSGGFFIQRLYQYSFDQEVASGKKMVFDKDWIKQAIEEIFKTTPVFDELRILIPVAMVLSKELSLPFRDPSKIKKVLAFEMEPYIIFDPEEVSLDFLETEKFADGKVHIIVAVLRDQDCAKLVSTLKSFDKSCSSLGVDAFVEYELIRSLPEYAQNLSMLLFLELGSQSITLGFVEKMALKSIRTFEIGLLDFLKNVQKESNKDATDILQYLANVGIKINSSDDFDILLKQYFLALFKEIVFSLEAFLLNVSAVGKVEKLILFEGFIKIKNIEEVINLAMQVEVQKFPTAHFLAQLKTSVAKQVDQDKIDSFIKLIGYVVLPGFSNFDLGYKIFPYPDKKLLTKQLSLAALLVVFIFGYFFYFSFAQLNTLEEIAVQKEAEVIKHLKELQPDQSSTKKRIVLKTLMSEVVAHIEKKVLVQNESSYKVPDMLVMMLELTRLLDRTRFGIIIKNLSIKPDKENGFKYVILLQAVFDQTKSSSEVDNFASFTRVLDLSRRLVLLEPVKQEEDAGSKSSFGFSLRLGLGNYENNE